MSAPVFISVEAAAGILDLHPSTIRRYIGEGLLPGFKVAGKSVRVRREDVVGLAVPIPTRER